MLLAILTCGIVFSACHKNNDPEPDIPPVVPVVKDIYAIHGVVTNMKNEIIPGAAIKLTGVATGNTTTNDKGEFTFNTLESKGKYTVEVSKSGYTTTITDINLSSTLITIAIQLPNEPVKASIDSSKDSNLFLPKENNTPNIDVNLNIPAGALTDNKEISVTEVPDMTADKAASLIILNYQPDGTTFKNPCTISFSNPIDDYELADVKLQWLNPLSNKWEDHSESVTFDGTSYITTINHFSSYKITGFSQGVSSQATENFHTSSVDNLNGKGDVKIEGVPYTYKRGVMYVTTPEAAAAAAGISNKKVIDFIKSAVYAEKSFTDVSATYAINVTIPVGVRMDIKGSQEFTTTNYTFNFKKGKDKFVVSITTKAAGIVTINTSLYTKEHTGGSGS